MKKDKLVALILSSVMASMCMVTPISAEEYLVNRPPISQSPNGIATYDWMYPTRTWDLSKNPYEYSGNATKSEIYTNYRFYGVDSLAIQITTNTAPSLKPKKSAEILQQALPYQLRMPRDIHITFLSLRHAMLVERFIKKCQEHQLKLLR